MNQDEPIYFASSGHTLFGWLHHPAQSAQQRVGAIICKPFGFESLCAHRSLRTMAETAAAAGVPTLRFDYGGCGDSEDLDPGADQVEAWINDILAAARLLRERTGVSKVCLVGVRLGALLATLAAARSDDIQGLFLFAPVLSGKRYLRELRAAGLAGEGAQFAEAPAASAPRTDGPCDASSREFGGHFLSGPTLTHLAQVDFSAASHHPRVERIFIADRSDLPSAQNWSGQLQAAGVAMTYAQLSGFIDMALVAPHEAVVPTAVVQALRDWLLGHPYTPTDAAPPALAPEHREIVVDAKTALNLAQPGESAHAAIRETPVTIASGASIFGILTEPGPQEKRRRAVILLNTGADYHMGVSRTYVSLARTWARRGYHVLRMDLTGIGDSGSAPGQAQDVVYSPTALADVRAALEFMRTRTDASDITLAGVCSGAYHSLRAAAAGLPVNRILMVNPLTYFWEPGAKLSGLQLAEIVRNPGLYSERVGSLHAWKRLLTGQVSIVRILSVYVQRPLLSVRSKVRSLARDLGIRLRRDLGRELQDISARGVRIAFVFARGETGLPLLELEAGTALQQLGTRCRIRVIDEGDHTFTQKSASLKLGRVLNEELFSRLTAEPDLSL